ncbi:MAG: hypothetical protein Q7W45_17410 [Bacteroidota bacterium]|nr:hypothetical protein [Bacteroidota bacterium]MDP3145205.1 hypothetical protein [Bacteroidota bacterium]MDP3557270.1 hypothetical protein [Bacteroidota bacterium]
MKAIISHDIDHISIFEHTFKDAIIPKFIARMHIELLSGKISLREYTLRWTDFFKNKWQNIDELITYNNINNVPSSFFIAVNRGVGLNYSNRAALLWIQQMQKRNCEINIHGIEFDDFERICEEHSLFKSLTKSENFGVRMHYVRNNNQTYSMLDKAGYRFDSTEYAFKNPYKIGAMWEFPFQIMDGWILENGKKWQSLNFKQAKENTIKIIDKAHQENLLYLGIDFHDRYFSHSFKTWLDWYMWLVDYLKNNNIEFVNYNMAINELEVNK